MGEPEPLSFRMVLVGDSAAGKTSLTHRFVAKRFIAEPQPTIGIDVKANSLERDERELKVQFFDTAGQEQFRAMSSVYLKDCKAVMIVYDITNEKSFLNLEDHLKEVRANTEDAVIMVVGNKLDERHIRQVYDEAVTWCVENKVEALLNDKKTTMHAVVSALSGEGVEDAFTQLIDATYEKFFRRQVLLDKINSELVEEDDEPVRVRKPHVEAPPPKKSFFQRCCSCCAKKPKDDEVEDAYKGDITKEDKRL